MSDLISIDGSGVKNKQQETLRKLENDFDHTVRALSILAKITRAKYEALLKEGFTEAQALELCK